MREQSYKHEYGTPPADPGLPCLPPVEGRVDVAEDVEEEQRRAYSTRQTKSATSQEETMQVQQACGDQRVSLADLNQAELPPVEGRVDVAEDVEEEQRDAYSAHHG